MSKTPVSTLQEYMAKQALGPPEYVIVSQTSGTHLTNFTYRVQCLGREAKGMATSKKEAKHNAAKEMLKLLGQQSLSSPSLSPQKIVPADSYYSPGVSDNTHGEIFVNSVGKLNEHCVSRKLKNPEYTVSDISGPDHMRMFTITCSIGSLSAKATATTKKQAKQDAAQKMYQLLMTTTTSGSHHDLRQNVGLSKIVGEAEQQLSDMHVMDIKMDKSALTLAESRAKAEEYFPYMRYRDSVKIVKNLDVKDYYEALKKTIGEPLRAKAKEKLQNRIDQKLNVKNDRFVLDEVLKVLDLELQCTTMARHGDKCVVRCTLDTTPVITDFGVGKDIVEATEQAYSKLLHSIDLYLK